VVCYIFDLVEIDHLGIAAQCWHAVSGQVPGGDTLSQILLLRFQEGRLKPVEHFDELFLLFLVQDAYPGLLMLMDDRAKPVRNLPAQVGRLYPYHAPVGWVRLPFCVPSFFQRVQ
jgi:hypothetical protein